MEPELVVRESLAVSLDAFLLARFVPGEKSNVENFALRLRDKTEKLPLSGCAEVRWN